MACVVVGILLAASRGWGVRLREVSVPAVVVRGEPVWLNCSFDLDPAERLYSLKWHKDGLEFYRYLPADAPQEHAYPAPGVHIDWRRSSRGHLLLGSTDERSEGSYRCEVSTDAPHFQMVKGERRLRIYVKPRGRPEVRGIRALYALGEVVEATCQAAPSRPPAFLKWWINGQEARAEVLRGSEPLGCGSGLWASRLGLRFAARPHHFFGGRLRLQCEAVVSQAHTLRSEEIIVDERGAATWATPAYEPSKELGPRIRGAKPSYAPGDLLDVNCSAASAQPPPELRWYINDKEVPPEYLLREGETSLRLRFEVRQRHFQRREMRVRCTATLSVVKRMTSEPAEAHPAPSSGSAMSRSRWSVVGAALLCLAIAGSIPRARRSKDRF